jgi:RNA polymerase sigma factor (sigma-70 family)
MSCISLSPEEEELLDMLEAGSPPHLDRFHDLFARLIECHWRTLVAHVEQRCFGDDVHPLTIATDTCVRAYELLKHQLFQPPDASTAAVSMRYSRLHCPQFVGFLKALARWKHLDAARQASGYHTMIARLMQYECQQAQEYGTWRSRQCGTREPLRNTAPEENHPKALWDLIQTLPSRERLVVRLYYQYSATQLSLQAFTELASNMELPAKELSTLQRRFRRLVRGQPTATLHPLTQDTLAALFDVDRETIRRLLVKAKRHLREALIAQSL